VQRHQTQWAAPFAAASELCKPGYEKCLSQWGMRPRHDGHAEHGAPLIEEAALAEVEATVVALDLRLKAVAKVMEAVEKVMEAALAAVI
jgi:hypothetical protein